MNAIVQKILASPCGHLNPHLAEPLPAKKARPVEKISAEKVWIAHELTTWCSKNGLVLDTEYRFARPRRWRADWAILEKNILIEYEGLFSKKSRHTTPAGFTGDTDKYNAAQVLGYNVLRFTAINYHNIISELQKFI